MFGKLFQKSRISVAQLGHLMKMFRSKTDYSTFAHWNTKSMPWF